MQFNNLARSPEITTEGPEAIASGPSVVDRDAYR
jgi:hypothetical protein